MKLLRIMTALMLIAFAGIVLSVPRVHADSVSVGDMISLTQSYGGAGGGGSFHVWKGGAVLFDTFCIETNEYFTPGKNYYVGSISSVVILGGSGGGSPDPLDPRTGYLYSQWYNHNLTTTFNYTSDADANALQKAIWYIEQELGNSDWKNPQTYLSGEALLLYNEALNANPNYLTSNNLWGVQVINMYAYYNPATGTYSGLAQDQLVYVPEPSTLLLLGAGLVGLWGIRRKFRK